VEKDEEPELGLVELGLGVGDVVVVGG